MQSSAVMQQSFTRGQGNCFVLVNKVEEKGKEEEKEEEKVEEENKQQEKDEIRTTMQASTGMQQSCTRSQGDYFLLSNE